MQAIVETSAKDEFWQRGFVIRRSVFTPAEMALLRRAVTTSDAMTGHSQRVQAKFMEGKYPSFETIFVWNDTSGDDIFAKITRSHKIMGLISTFFDDDVYVYHNKVALKYPNMPGFRYHQDYYYWYGMGCLYPDLATCFVAIDPATRSNGCLKLIEGSHRLGRMDHLLYDGVSDSGIDEARLAVVLRKMPERHIELAPGDCVIFHCNTLHGSDANMSNQSRLALLGCYNTRHNDPFIRSHEHPNFLRQSLVYDPVTESDLCRLPDFSLKYDQVEG